MFAAPRPGSPTAASLATAQPPKKDAPKMFAAMTPEGFRALLDASGLTQAAAADRLGVTGARVFNWPEGRTPITDGRAAHIRAHPTRGALTDRQVHRARGSVPGAVQSDGAVARGMQRSDRRG